MRFAIVIAFAVLMLWPSAARAEVAASGPSAFLVQAETNVPRSVDDAWRALVRVERWWNSAHTYSGDARRLRLDPRAGGCWCERWGDGQSAEHGRVVLVMTNDGTRTLRVMGGFGPLQEMGVTGVPTFTLTPDSNGAKVAMTYRVAGEPGLGLDQIAPPVDQVLMEQFARLARYIETGAPE